MNTGKPNSFASHHGSGIGNMDTNQLESSVEVLEESVINMAIESWRFGRVFNRLLGKLDAGEHKRYHGQFNWFIKSIEESLNKSGLKIVNVEGHPYDPGIAATPLNIDEFDENDQLMVDQMLEPIIMSNEGLVKTGTVTLRRLDK